MQTSQKRLARHTQEKITQEMMTVLSNLHNEQAAQNFFTDFFSPTEQVVLLKRLAIVIRLSRGESYEHITNELKVSTATVSFLAAQMTKTGIKVILEKIHEDEWAEKLVQNLKNPFGRRKNTL